MILFHKLLSQILSNFPSLSQGMESSVCSFHTTPPCASPGLFSAHLHRCHFNRCGSPSVSSPRTESGKKRLHSHLYLLKYLCGPFWEESSGQTPDCLFPLSLYFPHSLPGEGRRPCFWLNATLFWIMSSSLSEWCPLFTESKWQMDCRQTEIGLLGKDSR